MPYIPYYCPLQLLDNFAVCQKLNGQKDAFAMRQHAKISVVRNDTLNEIQLKKNFSLHRVRREIGMFLRSHIHKFAAGSGNEKF